MDFTLAARDADNRAAAGTLEKYKVLALFEALFPRDALACELYAVGEEVIILRLAPRVLPRKSAEEREHQRDKSEDIEKRAQKTEGHKGKSHKQKAAPEQNLAQLIHTVTAGKQIIQLFSHAHHRSAIRYVTRVF